MQKQLIGFCGVRLQSSSATAEEVTMCEGISISESNRYESSLYIQTYLQLFMYSILHYTRLFINYSLKYHVTKYFLRYFNYWHKVDRDDVVENYNTTAQLHADRQYQVQSYLMIIIDTLSAFQIHS